MVKIHHNSTNDTFEVTKGAYDKIYKNQGYGLVKSEAAAKDHSNADTNQHTSEDEAFAEALMEKPISQWSKDEVKKFVAIRGIDTTGAKNVAEVKDIIKSVLS